jgi:hypothetical protein
MGAQELEVLQTVALASLLAWASGIRLYLVVFVLGLSAQHGYIVLPEGLKVLVHPYVVWTSGLLLAAEFLADKFPGFDSFWDSLHTLIRIPAGALLAAGATGDTLSALTIAAGLLGGTITAGTHFTKAGSRAVINSSPEPFSNWAASFTEDVLVLGGIWLAFNYPLVFLALLVAFLALVAWLLPKLWRLAKRVWKAMSLPGEIRGQAPNSGSPRVPS